MTRKFLVVLLVACVFATQAFTTPPPRASRAHSTTAPADVVYNKDTNETIWVNNPPPGLLPTGMTHHTYFSKSMNETIGYCIYLPPAYQKHPKQRFPVIYNLHGINRNELHGMQEAQLLDDGINAGQWPDMIMVFPNGGCRSFYQDSDDSKLGKVMAETTVIRELIPHIDQTYRTIPTRDGRCIEGFSMGGLGAMYFAVKYPDLFCSLFSQAGNATHGGDKPDTFALLQQNLDQINGKLRIQIFCGTQDSHHLPSLREFHQSLTQAGVDHTYLEIEGLPHDLPKMMEQYRAIWFDFHVESLRRLGASPGPTSLQIEK